MSDSRIVTGGLLVAVPLVFTAGFTGLQMSFEYPAILRHPAGEVLQRFAAGGADLHLYWYLMFAAALGLIPASIALGMRLWKADRLLAGLSVGLGVLAGLVQALGLLRWVILVPALAADFTAPGASATDQAMAAALFDAANRYIGAGVGEHLGYLFTGAWTLTVAGLIWARWKWLAVAGVVIAIGVVFGMAEPFGVPGAAMVNSIAFSLWALWALVLGVMVLRSERGAARVVAQAA